MGRGNFTEDFKLDAIKQITKLSVKARKYRKQIGCKNLVEPWLVISNEPQAKRVTTLLLRRK